MERNSHNMDFYTDDRVLSSLAFGHGSCIVLKRCVVYYLELVYLDLGCLYWLSFLDY